MRENGHSSISCAAAALEDELGMDLVQVCDAVPALIRLRAGCAQMYLQHKPLGSTREHSHASLFLADSVP